MNFQDEIRSIPTDNFKDHYGLVFDFTEMPDAPGNNHYPELVRKPLKLELNFTYPLKLVAELIVLGERMSLVAVDKFLLLAKLSKTDFVSLQLIIDRILLLKYRYLSSYYLTTLHLLIMTLLQF